MIWRKNQTQDEPQFTRRHLRYKTNVRHHYANPLFPKFKPQGRSFSPRLKSVLILIPLIALAWFFLYSSVFRIDQVFIEGNEELSREQITDVVTNTMNERRWFILPQSNIFLLSSERLKNALDEAYVFESLSIDRHFRYMSLSVNVKERIPGLTFVSQNRSYYLDLHGFVTHAVGEGEEIRPTFPVVRDHNNRPTAVKQQMMSEPMVQALFTIRESLPKETPFTIESFVLPQVTCHETIEEEIPLIIEIPEDEAAELLNANTNQNTNQKINANTNQNLNSNSNENSNANVSLLDTGEKVLRKKEVEVPCKDYLTVLQDLHARLNDGPEVYFDSTRPIEPQVMKLKSTVEHELPDVKGITYIDLRFEDRVFYK